MLITTLLDVVLPIACVGACALVGRHYERRCAEHRAFCDDMEHNAHQFAEQARRTHDRLLAGSIGGRHALREEPGRSPS